MKPMPRLILAGALVTIVALVAACSGSTGGLGSVPSIAPAPFMPGIVAPPAGF